MSVSKDLTLTLELVVVVEPEEHYTQEQLDKRLADPAFREQVGQAIGAQIRLKPDRVGEMDENGYLYVTDLVAEAVFKTELGEE